MNEISSILEERQRTHGSFAASAAIAQALKQVLMQGPNFNELDHVKIQALEMIATKLARIVCGDAQYLDVWLDVEGYAELVVRDIRDRRGDHESRDQNDVA